MINTQKQSISALPILISVFFFWGFVAASNDILIPVFKSSLGLKNWQAQLVNFAFYMAYTIGSVLYVSLAYFKKKDILQKKAVFYNDVWFLERRHFRLVAATDAIFSVAKYFW